MLAAWATSIGVAALFYRFVESPAASRRIATAVAWPVKGLFGRGAAWAASPARIRKCSSAMSGHLIRTWPPAVPGFS